MLFAAPSLGVSLKSRWAQCELAFPSGLDLASTIDPGIGWRNTSAERRIQ